MPDKLTRNIDDIEIQPIQPDQVEDAKRVILTFGRKLYRWEENPEEIYQWFDDKGEFSDMDDFQAYYSNQEGVLLVVTDADEVIGSGGVYRFDDRTCELRRMWLLEPYQGKGIGYRIFGELIDFARRSGYTRMRLETGHEQERAILFYQRVGFRPIKPYNDRNSDVYMELEI
jgi:putative acetyltransferase